jgi:hypothetical protein
MIDLSLLFHLIAYSLAVGVCGYTLTVLMTPGELLDAIPAIMIRLVPRDWMIKLVQCEKCIAGQMALYSFPFVFWPTYHPINHVVAVLFSIFTAIIIAKLLPVDNE